MKLVTISSQSSNYPCSADQQCTRLKIQQVVSFFVKKKKYAEGEGSSWLPNLGLVKGGRGLGDLHFKCSITDRFCRLSFPWWPWWTWRTFTDNQWFEWRCPPLKVSEKIYHWYIWYQTIVTRRQNNGVVEKDSAQIFSKALNFQFWATAETIVRRKQV